MIPIFAYRVTASAESRDRNETAMKTDWRVLIRVGTHCLRPAQGLMVILGSMIFRIAALGDVPVRLVGQGKEAAALVEVQGGQGFAPAFCVDPTGLYFTNEHAVHGLGGGTVTLSSIPMRQDSAASLRVWSGWIAMATWHCCGRRDPAI